jgi:cytoskeletal protein CcmA (bactofilin family)
MAGTLLDAEGSFEGSFSGKDAQVLGRFKGDIKVSGRLAIGEAARVEARVTADVVEIAGQFRGEVRARSIVLGEKARVDGTLDTQLLAVKDGAVLNASVNAGVSAGDAQPATSAAVFSAPATVR